MDETTQKHQNLEDVSKQVAQHQEKRRVPRLAVATELFRHGATGKIFPVVDLSGPQRGFPGGMAFRVLEAEDLRSFPVSSFIEGTLSLKGEKFSIRAKVRHLCGLHVGSEFDALTDITLDKLQTFLDPSILGSDLKAIPAAGERAIWYHGPSGTDLLFWRSIDGQFEKQAIYLLGNFIHWDSNQGLQTGVADVAPENVEIRGVIRFEMMLHRFDPKPDPKKLSIAKTFLVSSNLPEDLKSWSIRHLVPRPQDACRRDA